MPQRHYSSWTRCPRHPGREVPFDSLRGVVYCARCGGEVEIEAPAQDGSGALLSSLFIKRIIRAIGGAFPSRLALS